MLLSGAGGHGTGSPGGTEEARRALRLWEGELDEKPCGGKVVTDLLRVCRARIETIGFIIGFRTMNIGPEDAD